MLDPRVVFGTQLEAGARLCLLPISRIKVEEPLQLADELIIYPQGSISPGDLRVVSYPAHEFRETKRRSALLTPGRIEVSGIELSWFKSAATQIEIQDFFDYDLLALPVTLDWDAFLSPESHEAHLDMLSQAMARAEVVMDIIRFRYCRIDVSETLPGRVGYMPKPGYTAGLFYSIDDHESYIVAGEIVSHQVVVGLGLELDDITRIEQLGNGEAGQIARHALRMNTMALEAPDDTAKFIQLITLIDYLAEPYKFISMQDAKKRIARHAAANRADYDSIIADFKFLTSEGGTSGESNRGLRHNIFHLGKRLDDLLKKEERRKVLRRLNRYAGVTLEHIIGLSALKWSAVEAFRLERGIALGLESD